MKPKQAYLYGVLLWVHTAPSTPTPRTLLGRSCALCLLDSTALGSYLPTNSYPSLNQMSGC